MRDEAGVPLRDAENHRAAPVVPADDDLVRADCFGDAGYGVGVGFEAVVAQVGGVALGVVSWGSGFCEDRWRID